SELVTLTALDSAPLGLGLDGTDVRIGTTHSGIAGGPVHAAAEARLVKASVLGRRVPELALGARAYQQAPPPHERAEASSTAALALGGLRLGAGGLSARATWQDASRCEPTGPRASSTSSMIDGSVGHKLVSWGALETATATEVVTEAGKAAAAATATGSV